MTAGGSSADDEKASECEQNVRISTGAFVSSRSRVSLNEIDMIFERHECCGNFHVLSTAAVAPVTWTSKYFTKDCIRATTAFATL